MKRIYKYSIVVLYPTTMESRPLHSSTLNPIPTPPSSRHDMPEYASTLSLTTAVMDVMLAVGSIQRHSLFTHLSATHPLEFYAKVMPLCSARSAIAGCGARPGSILLRADDFTGRGLHAKPSETVRSLINEVPAANGTS